MSENVDTEIVGITNETLEKTKLNHETSSIGWSELQRYFAQGLVLYVDKTLDLIDVGYQMSVDNKATIEQWLKEGSLAQVSDEQALHWNDNDQEFWAVVVRPWVLVQEKVN
ncbi:DUF2288 domain-containing protein [Endozoicomonas ascidiicola]|uniref:DUF2288 domain-containing protein n=1 Tax=Endozoicomonas ascidiicola TaxID=1698521 RepID=UPI0008356DC6|nr:DUF2288 domain-containing protein [Endozoicomonas ascidiicola]